MNTETKHTPGPWRIGKIAHPDGRPYGLETAIFSHLDGVKIAVVETWIGDSTEEAEANSELIASAPDMAKEIAQLKADRLEIVAGLMAAIRDVDNPHDVLPRSRITLSMATQQQIRELIAKHSKV